MSRTWIAYSLSVLSIDPEVNEEVSPFVHLIIFATSLNSAIHDNEFNSMISICLKQSDSKMIDHG